MSLIEIKDIYKVYKLGENEVRALDGVSLSINAGEFVAIMGPSGSGKSTMLQILGLLDTPDSGSYKLLGKEVSTLTEDELAVIRSQTLGFVFQFFNLLSRTSALTNAQLPLLYSDPQAPHDDPKALLEEVGLAKWEDHRPNELSGGQQQRVALARALVNRPKLLMADEPTGNLDTKSSMEIMAILEKLNREGITIIMVTHEPDIAKYARRVIHMRDGKIESDHGGHAAHAPQTRAPKLSTKESVLSVISFKRVEEYFDQAFRALMANKVRAALSFLGILIGVGAVITMMAIGTGAQKSMAEQMASLGTNLEILIPGSIQVGGVQQGTGSWSRILPEYAWDMAKLPMVKAVAPEVTGHVQTTYADQNWYTLLSGTSPSYAEMRDAEPIYGRFFNNDEVAYRKRVCLLGMTVVKQLFGDANPIGEYMKINRVSFLVIGILPVKGSNGFQDRDDLIVVPYTTAMRRLFGKFYVSQVDIEVDKLEDTDAVGDAAKAYMMKLTNIPDLPGNENAYMVRSMADIQAMFNNMTRIMTLLLSCVAAISLLVGGIGIMNIMLVSVTERTKEIGLRKALGARRLDILSQFLIEAMTISLMGGLAGILIGWGASKATSYFAGWQTIITAFSVIISTLFSALVGIAFGLWPAYKASRLSPILALRYE
jgi:macrolide transport system ATP-binding/permease protein